VHAKAKSLKDRLDLAIEKGAEFELRQGDNKKGKMPGQEEAEEEGSQLNSDEDYAKMIADVEARKGDMCCYMIYNHPSEADPRTTSLLAKLPKFTLRDAIERDESFGTEKAKQAG